MRTLTREDFRPYQGRASSWIRDKRLSGLIVDMGLGKTVAVNTAISDLLDLEELTGPVLLVSTIRVIRGVWRQEGAKWTHTKHLRYSLVHGTERERIAALAAPADIYLVAFSSLTWLMARAGLWTFRPPKVKPPLISNAELQLLGLPPPKPPKPARVVEKDESLQDRFGALVIDESSFFKDPSTDRFKSIKPFVPLVRKRHILTGTPRPNQLMDLWAQVYILDGGKRLGTSFSRFRDRFFEADYMGYNYWPREGAAEYIYKQIADLMLRLDAKDYLDLPPVIKNVVKVQLPTSSRVLYKKMEREMIARLESGEQVAAVNRGVLIGKCQQIANGAVYSTPEDELLGDPKWHVLHDEKLDALEEIVEEAGGSPLLVAYWYKHDLIRLKAKYPRAPVFSEAKKPEVLEKEWNEGKHPLMFLHPATGGHGLNLQFGGNRLTFYSMFWSNEYHDQIMARIGPTRQMGLAANVIVHYIVAEDTVDEDMLQMLEIRGEGQTDFLNFLRGRYLAAPDEELLS